MSVVVTKAKLMAIINEEFQKVVAEASVLQPGTPEYEEYQATLRGEEPEDQPEAPARPHPEQWYQKKPSISSTGQVALPLKSKARPGGLTHSTVFQLPEPTGVRKTGLTGTDTANAPTVGMPAARKPGAAAPGQAGVRPAASAIMVGTPEQWVQGFKGDAEFAQAVLDGPLGEIGLLKLLAEPGGAREAAELVRAAKADRGLAALGPMSVKRAAKADARKPKGRFRNLLKRMVSEELELYVQELQEQQLEEVYSDKQRRWACAQASKPSGKRKKSLSKKEADEMCKGPILEPKKKGKKK